MRRRFLIPTIAALVFALAVPLMFSTETASPPSEDVVAAPPAPQVEPVATRTGTATVRRGDTLVTALTRRGLPRTTSHEIATAFEESGADLRRVRLRDEIDITWTLDGDPVAVRWEPSPWLAFAATLTEDGWEVTRTETRPDVRVEAVTGIVDRSLFEAVDAIGERPQLVSAFVQIFESEFDFTADTQPGDRFRMLIEKRYAGAAFVDYGRILAAQYRAGADVMTGVAAAGGGPGYYDLEARSLRKTFLRAPLDVTRITSGFTYRRPHPILGGVRPHLAIDYAAPVGTPVRAVADGVVLRSGWNGGNGIQVVLGHRAGYETTYNHLAKAVVRRGARVSQRQVVGHVGSTGLSTGPHLDYRVSRNGRFVNPLSEKFLPGEPLTGNARAAFVREAGRLVQRLAEEAPF